MLIRNGRNELSRLSATGAMLGRRLARVALGCAGLFIVVGGFVYRGLSAAAALTEILGFAVMVTALVERRGTEADLTEGEFATQLESQVGIRWRAEAQIRGLADRDFIPLWVVGSAEVDSSDGDQGLDFWSSFKFQHAAFELYSSMPSCQLIIIGDRGSGKSVFSLMLTLALLESSEMDKGKRPIPLPISISSWRPTHEDFANWFERRMLRAYPVIERTPKATNRGRVWDAVFSCRRRCLPILDGLDEIPDSERKKAVQQLASFFPPEHRWSC